MTNETCPELVFTRRFSMAHRLISGCSERCATPHGHNEYVTVTLGKGKNHRHHRLDGHNNMLLPFAEAKGRWHRFIDERIDHAFQLSDSDPLLNWFQNHEPQRMSHIIVTPGDPTTEIMAALLMAKLNAFLHEQGDKLSLKNLELRETPTNAVRLTGDPVSYLPGSDPATKDHWWNRADDTISDI